MNNNYLKINHAMYDKLTSLIDWENNTNTYVEILDYDNILEIFPKIDHNHIMTDHKIIKK